MPERRQNARSPKYAPAREDGLKPWLVECFDWGRTRYRIVYAESASEAVYEWVGRKRPGVYGSARRATPADMEVHGAR